MNYAPVAVFTYNRPDHTRRTINALMQNPLAEETHLIVFSDGPRKGAEDKVGEVRQFIDQINGFKGITKRYSSENRGLAESIIAGVTDIVNQYGRVIVLEDDIETSPGFLKYMNSGLDYYAENSPVWVINGWTPPDRRLMETPEETFFSRISIPWGWATWADRWQQFEKNTDKLIEDFTPSMIRKFNLDRNCPFWSQVLFNKSGKYSTWWVYWYASMFLKKGYALSSNVSFTRNTGLDGSGENCRIDGKESGQMLNSAETFQFHDTPAEDKQGLKTLRKWFREDGILKKIIGKIKRGLSID